MAKVGSQSSGRGSELSTLIQCALIVIPFPFSGSFHFRFR